MKNLHKKIILFLSVGILLFFTGCSEPKIIFPEAKSDADKLQSIKIGGVEISGFSSSIYTYNIKITEQQVNLEQKINIEVVKQNPKSTVSGDGLRTLVLNESNKITITVFSESEKYVTSYYLNVFYYDGGNTFLESLKIDGVVLSDFDCKTITYNYDIANTNTKATIEATCINPNSTISGTGEVTLDSSSDTTKVTLTVTSENKVNTATYNIFINKVNYDTDIYYNFGPDFSSLFQQNGFTTVIFGDSLSVGYGFNNGEGFNNAYNQYPGLLSWSHMMRDAIYRNDPDFIHADQVLVSSKYSYGFTDFVKSDNGVSNYLFPFNNRSLRVLLDKYKNNDGITQSDEKIKFNYTTETDNIVLYFSATPSDVGCSFEVYLDEVFQKTVDVSSVKDVTQDVVELPYRGYEPIIVNLTVPKPKKKGNYEIKLTNFKDTSISSTYKDNGRTKLGFYFNGIGSKYSPVYLTGRSSATTKFYVNNNYEELNERVLKHQPDFVILIIGANDSSNIYGLGAESEAIIKNFSGMVDVSQYKTNLQNIINKIRELKPYSKILLLSPPKWTNTNTSTEKIKTYVTAMKQIAIKNNCMFMDLIQFFSNFTDPKGIPFAIWDNYSVDDVHFSKLGNDLLADSILEHIMPQGLYPKDMIDTSKIYTTATNYFIQENGSIDVTYDATTKIFNVAKGYSKNYIVNVYREGPISSFRIYYHLNTKIKPAFNVIQTGDNLKEFDVRPRSIGYANGYDYNDFWILFKKDSSADVVDRLLTESDFIKYQEYLKFEISWW
ncbi:MAG: hypothetical protein A2086_04400 [Spirochaetes bacterium GWD1_27_9]|nr:MAG: hypothetical protein A2Z98_12165 [Spirochaetes bacterium GWB1_27_13]OHD26008.1 MAG: hypothetical protein A2Y34_00685 [Spirochaetes bacterium GWC1_27_15]OHD32327.1 MAG: hypothetical protein A2086_04400 [Spirochaetes bacterium GWD1_27_9]